MCAISREVESRGLGEHDSTVLRSQKRQGEAEAERGESFLEAEILQSQQDISSRTEENQGWRDKRNCLIKDPVSSDEGKEIGKTIKRLMAEREEI